MHVGTNPVSSKWDQCCNIYDRPEITNKLKLGIYSLGQYCLFIAEPDTSSVRISPSNLHETECVLDQTCR